MSFSPNRGQVLLLCVLNVVLVGAVVYLTVSHAFEEEPERLEVPACPECPKRQSAPLFPRLFKPVKFVADYYGMRYTGFSGNLIDEHVLFLGAYEKDILYCMRDVAAALPDKSGVFVDVGANTGLHSLFMSKHMAHVHAFEPFAPVLERFNASIAENAVENITVHPVGLGASRAVVPFHAPPDKNLGSGSFVAEFQPGNQKSSSLQIVVGDDALDHAGVKRVSIIKIDIEGYEGPALIGLAKTLERSRPIVFVEITVDQRLDETFKSESSLRSAFPKGYEFRAFKQTPRAAHSGNYMLEDPVFDFSRAGQMMLLAIPTEKRESLTAIVPVGSARLDEDGGPTH